MLSALDEVDLKLIELVYWRREYTVEGAAMAIHISKTAAYQRINKVLGAIAYALGYVQQ